MPQDNDTYLRIGDAPGERRVRMDQMRAPLYVYISTRKRRGIIFSHARGKILT